MLKKHTRLVRLTAMCLIACMLLSLAACNTHTPAETEGGQKETATYTITLTSQGGLPLTGVGIYIYTDSAQEELVWFAKTDDNGVVTFTDVVSDSYIAVLTGLPEGYQAEESYPITGEKTDIVLTADVTAEGDLSRITYSLGDSVYNFTFTAADGREYVLSELLEEKEAVVLNFWYLACSPCKMEFPYLQEAYEQYSDKIALLAMNPVDTDTGAVLEFKDELGLTFPMGLCDSNWESAMQITGYPTTVVIDRYGTIALVHSGSITETQTFQNIFGYFTAEDYVQSVVEDVDTLPDVEEREVVEVVENPTDIGGVTSFNVTVQPGEVVYVNVYKLSGMYMSIKNENAYVIYNGKTYEPTNGTVGLMVSSNDVTSAVRLGFGNSGTETQTYTINFSAPKGSYGNPYTLTLGTFNVSVNAGNNQGVYLTYTATEDGTLTMECLGATAGVNYDFVLYNLRSYAYRNIGPEGGLSVDGIPTVSVTVRKGDRVQVIVSALPDDEFSYPDATFNFSATFTGGAVEDEVTVQKQTYALTVTDENRKPVSGVTVYISGGDSTTALITDEKGVAGANLAVGTYTARVVSPRGYSANTVEFILTEKIPTLSVKLDTLEEVKTVVYTVKTVDEAGKAVSGSLVSVGDSFGYTDSTGKVTFTLPESSYTATVMPPDGYFADSVSYAFPMGKTELIVVLTSGSGSGESDGKVTYSVTVLDAAGEPLSQGVVVQFLKNGSPVAMKAADAAGTATTKLEPGDYTVSLAFNGKNMYYDTSAAVLSASARSITLTVAALTSDDDVTGLYVSGSGYNVYEGGNYIELSTKKPNYSINTETYGNNCFFVFVTEKSGVYQISIDSDAKLSYWGTSTSFIMNHTDSLKDYTGDSYTISITDDSIPNDGVARCIIGVEVTGGITDSILTITRIGDAESKIVVEDYVGSYTPEPYTLKLPSGKTLTYVDITAATSAYKLVYNTDDQFYHLNSASGPVILVNLGYDAPYNLSIKELLETTGMNNTYIDADGYIRGEDYTTLMCEYVECIDSTYGVYPLTKDLMYMIQQHGQAHDWWATDGFVFSSVPNLNTEIAWMYACCYAAN